LEFLIFLVAGHHGHAVIAGLLLARGADSKIQNNLGLTAHQEAKGTNGGKREGERRERKERKGGT
jgi:hypothetical protein